MKKRWRATYFIVTAGLIYLGSLSLRSDIFPDRSSIIYLSSAQSDNDDRREEFKNITNIVIKDDHFDENRISSVENSENKFPVSFEKSENIISRNDDNPGNEVLVNSKDAASRIPINAEHEEKHISEANSSTWELEQKRRLNLLNNSCWVNSSKEMTQSAKYQKLFQTKRNSLHNLLVDDEHQAIYCYLPKVGCTNWKTLWLQLTGVKNESELDGMVREKLHRFTPRVQLVKRETKLDEFVYKMQHYKKMIVVRHPFERLVSAYLDKIHHARGHKLFQEMALPYVIKNLRESANLKDITWKEFVSYVLSKNGDSNEHWRTYESQCLPCDVDYQVIIRFETINEDSEKFLRMIGAPENINFPEVKKVVGTSLVGNFVEELTPSLIDGLTKNFLKDYQRFGYQPPLPINT